MKIQNLRTTHNVPSSARTIADHKQMLALESVPQATMSLLHKGLATNTKAVVHFNTTSRNNIDGE